MARSLPKNCVVSRQINPHQPIERPCLTGAGAQDGALPVGVIGAEGGAGEGAGAAPCPCSPAQRIERIARAQTPLAARRLTVQRIALDVADELVHGQGLIAAFGCSGVAPAQVDLVQMARAVVQVVQRPLGMRLAGQRGQHGLGAVA